ncbi:rhoptry neck protein 6, putative [Plasmodium vinckei brucechwatti]|uniref:Rhoptry neck protein 6, putative n=1 Tax=Plasmodium vinckei brucechwatti TaxID=119398 RepID=A0A6V7RVQ0_PLAVN|nr:rhoptry neck protein 6, putative [Plasmodium vinckei brucechwatti]
MYYYLFILFALCANGLLRNKDPGNFVSSNDEAIRNSKDINAFGMSQNGTLYLNIDSNLNETPSESFLENCNINSCVDISHENHNTTNNQKNDHLINNNNNNLKVEYPNGINNNILKEEKNEHNLSNKLEDNTIHVNTDNAIIEKNDNLKKNTEGAINIMHTQKENLSNVKKGEIISSKKNKDKDLDDDDDEMDDEKDNENLDSSMEDEYKDSEDDDADEDKEEDENENENEKPYKKVTEISSGNNTKEKENILGNNPENMTAISEAGSNLQTPKFRIHTEKDKIKTNKERVESDNKRVNEFDITNDNKMGNTKNREVDNGISNQLRYPNNEKNFHEIQTSQNGIEHGARFQGEKVENTMLGDNQLDGEKLDGEKLDGEKLDGEKLDGEKLDGEKLDGEKLDGEKLDGEKLDGGKLDDDNSDDDDLDSENLDDEKLDDEKLDDKNLDDEKLDGKKKKKNVENDDSEMDKENDEEDEGDEDEPIGDDSIKSKEINIENKSSFSNENQKIIPNKDNKNYNEPDANCSKIMSDKVENTILQTTKIDQDIHQVKEKGENTKPSLNVSKNNDHKPEQNYESNMFTIDKKMHNKLNNIDGILHGLNDKLNHHKDLKNLELKLKFEAMGRIQKYKMYNEVIQKAIETLTQRLAKVNDDLNKLKEVSSISLQKYMNETGYGLESLNFPKSDLPLKK